MDLRKRLERYGKLARKHPRARSPVQRSTDIQSDEYLTARLRLEPIDGPSGRVWTRLVERPGVLPPDLDVPDFSGVLPAATPEGLNWSDVLFLDTETTGLAGGTGTLAFLVGLAWWDEGTFWVRQLFLSGPGREVPLLDALAAEAARFRVVATYNGGAFDLPLLRTRSLLARHDNPLAGLMSWDLLTGARRLWGRGLPDCRQQSIEQFVCGRIRGEGDIEGAAIPATYQTFLQEGWADGLIAVLRHNRRDMDGMGRILTELGRQTRDLLLGPDAGGETHVWIDAWSRALVAERRRDRVLAAAWSREQVDRGLHVDGTPASVLDAVRMLKREADWPRIERSLAAALVRWPDNHRLRYEAAVLYEHHLSNLQQALTHAEILADTHRLERLRNRIASDVGRSRRRQGQSPLSGSD